MDNGGTLLKNSKYLKNVINAQRILSCYYYNFLELLAVKNNFFQKLLIKGREPVFINEIKMAKVTKNDKVLLIGCGMFPSETITIVKQTGAKVIGIDNSKNITKIANKYITKIGLSNLIKIEYGEGSEYPVKDFDVIFIAINVWPIDSILNHLEKNMKSDAKIMCKSSRNDIIKIIDNERFTILSKLKNPQTQSFLLMKKNK
jgi:protein-L-isoaspartate O-methyltransferase